MQQNLEVTLALLTRTPAALNALLRDLPEDWTHRNEGENTWTVFDVMVHLIHSERTNWMPRINRLFQLGETRPFDQFDRRGYMQESQGKPLPGIAGRICPSARRTLRELSALNLREGDMERRGQHPALGAVTLAQLLATWAATMTHLHQISRVMAHQYRGAWPLDQVHRSHALRRPRGIDVDRSHERRALGPTGPESIPI